MVVYLLIPTSNHNFVCAYVRTHVLYIFWFLHQTTTAWEIGCGLLSCISFDCYIKPQHNKVYKREKVCCISFDSYIKPQLYSRLIWQSISCISFDSYIKPQHSTFLCSLHRGCISFDSYIKPQLPPPFIFLCVVVYLLIPTSNHNCITSCLVMISVVYLLIPTSNHNAWCLDGIRHGLYIFWFLHQTTTANVSTLSISLLYIFWFLHQTTTLYVD